VGTGAAKTLDPSLIMQIGMGFQPSKTLLSAVELGLFTALGSGELTGPAIAERLELRSRAVYGFLDGLVALRLLEREGLGKEARYRNTAETALFLDRNSPGYIGGVFEMTNARSYGLWGGLTEALQSGQAQNETKRTGRSMFEELYRDHARLEQFMHTIVGGRWATFMPWPTGSTSPATRPSVMWAVPSASYRSSWPSATPTCGAPPSTFR
jgi:Dimerisation domain